MVQDEQQCLDRSLEPVADKNRHLLRHIVTASLNIGKLIIAQAIFFLHILQRRYIVFLASSSLKLLNALGSFTHTRWVYLPSGGTRTPGLGDQTLK